MSKLQALYDKRADSVRTIEELRENMPEEGWNTEDQAKFDKAYADYSAISKSIDNYQKSEAISKEIDGEKLFEAEKRKKGEAPKYKDVFIKYLAGEHLNSEEHGVLKMGSRADNTPDDGIVRHSLPEGHQDRALSSTVGAGGYTIPEEWENLLYKSMAYFGPFATSGSQIPGQVGRVIRTTHGRTMHFPRTNDTGNSGRQITEATGDASSGTTDPTFTEMQMGAYKYTSDLIKVSSELLTDSGVDIGSELVSLLAERLGRIFNSELTNGLGVTNPKGITHAATIYDATAAVGAITQAELRGLKYSVDRAYRSGPQVGFMMHDSTISYILGLDTSTANYVQPTWQPSFREGEPDKILGHRYWVNNDLGELSDTGGDLALFGDWSKFYIRIVQGIRTAIARERYIENDVVAFVSFMRFDSDLIDANAIKYLKEDAT